MRERPILFSAPMVRAIIDGRKTQTRRVVKPQPTGFVGGPGVTLPNGSPAPLIPLDETVEPFGREIRCPYGQPGDRLWVREAFRFLDSFDGDSPERVGDMCQLAGYPKPWAPTQYEADGGRDNWMNVGTAPGSITAGKLRPGIHMPRWASRILLEITAVRVERLQDISDSGAQNDCTAEGVFHCGMSVPSYEQWHGDGFNSSEKWMYRKLWESINGPGSWSANPWIWVVEFKRVQP